MGLSVSGNTGTKLTVNVTDKVKVVIEKIYSPCRLLKMICSCLVKDQPASRILVELKELGKLYILTERLHPDVFSKYMRLIHKIFNVIKCLSIYPVYI